MFLPGERWEPWERSTRRSAWATPFCWQPEAPSRTSGSSSRSGSREPSEPESWPGAPKFRSSWAETFAAEPPSEFGSAGQVGEGVPNGKEWILALETFYFISTRFFFVQNWLFGETDTVYIITLVIHLDVTPYWSSVFE